MLLTGAVCEDGPDDVLDKDFSVVLQAANELLADSVVVLLLGGGRLEATHRWNEADGFADASAALLAAGPDLHEALARGGSVAAGTSLARFLRDAAGASSDGASNSFLLFTRAVRKCVVIIAFGFAARTPPHPEIPAVAADRLNLAAFATWSVRQLDRLHAELRVVNQKLASRKLVERAKALLQAQLQVDEQQAYEHLRKTSRQRRITMAKLAEEVLRRSAADAGRLFEPE